MHGRISVKSPAQQIVEAREGKSIDELLVRLYHAERLTQDEIARRLAVDVTTVRRWMKELGIPSRYLGPRKAAV